MDVDAVRVPDSTMVRRAIEKAEEVYAVRSGCTATGHTGGALLAQADDVAFDPELLMIASLLHDIGIAPVGVSVSDTCCFSVPGGRLAEPPAGVDRGDRRRVGRVRLPERHLGDAVGLGLGHDPLGETEGWKFSTLRAWMPPA